MNPVRTDRSRPPLPAPLPRAYLGAAAALLVIHLACCFLGANASTGGPVSPTQLQLRLDPNRASAAELGLLPRVGERIAENIIACRESTPDLPAFRRPEDLARVPRIGPATVELLRPYLCFPDSSDEPAGEQDSP